MHITITSAAASVPAGSAAENTPARPPAAPAGPAAAHDQATISAAGHEALRQDRVQPDGAASAELAAERSAKAVQLGKALQHSDPAKYRQADPDGDGRLTIAEAKAAGLMS